MTAKEDQAFVKSLKEFIGGTVGGWSQVIVGHPFDTVKVRLQTQPDPPKYKGAIDCVKVTLKEEGPRGLYKGVASPLMGIGICNAILFSANGNFRRLLQGGDESRVLSLAEITLAGGLAGSVMAFANCPVELLKVKLQAQNTMPVSEIRGTPYKGVIDCGIRTFKDRGLAGLYRGITITIIRDVPSYASYFFAYEGMKRWLASNKQDTDLTSGDLLLAGGIAGIAAWLPCYPQDVLKSRMQNNTSYKSTADCFRALVAQKMGVKSFFKGFTPTLARAFPANAATFFAYESAMKLLRN
ncbi:uncharacterized protein VTP21DRAFT_1465 [Calcarisporiella thermophila]|uniref:uncharacterized protein n=1 Tax=Calcarisporiella thermophila TaxID=911321 RepID=UPI00374224D3